MQDWHPFPYSLRFAPKHLRASCETSRAYPRDSLQVHGEARQSTFRGAAAIAATLLVALLMSGCSVYMAAHQPDAKDVSVLSLDQPRARLIAEFGTPVNTQVANGVKTDIFTFTQGYSTAEKAGRAVFHGAADVFTAVLWEAVGTPTESVFNGTQVSAQGPTTRRIASPQSYR